MIPVASLLVIFYNRQFYELKVARITLKNESEESPISEHNYHYFKFLKYTVYVFLTEVLCFKLNWSDCHRINRILNAVNHQMDMRNIINKKNFIEKKDKLFQCLMAPSSIKITKIIKKIEDYYEAVVEEDVPYNFYDVWATQD